MKSRGATEFEIYTSKRVVKLEILMLLAIACTYLMSGNVQASSRSLWGNGSLSAKSEQNDTNIDSSSELLQVPDVVQRTLVPHNDLRPSRRHPSPQSHPRHYNQEVDATAVAGPRPPPPPPGDSGPPPSIGN
ncbi:hypothetical protein Mapa_005244 [Marchantia paleacea]|nr:hypothetical protein Mapa_005244 [Marchantia paleacea]